MVARERTPEQVRLILERAEAQAELNHLRQEMQVEVDFDIDEADVQITEHETAAILAAMLEHKIQDIDSALAAIELGRYEYCERCGQSIEQERLRVKPDARFCVACQQVVERITACTHIKTPVDAFLEW
jgi:DnaK suppressor protein